MKIIKIPNPIQLLRYKHPSHLSIKTHKPLKIRTTFNTKSIENCSTLNNINKNALNLYIRDGDQLILLEYSS